MKTRSALVLSGGGMFGAWQAGAWRVLADKFQPDLIVGASVGSLNGWVIAGGATPAQLTDFWLRGELTGLKSLPDNIKLMIQHYPLRMDYAAVLTDVFRMKPQTFRGPDITWRHLAASCAVPGILPPYRIDGRWYVDGGLQNALPVFAAVELGATRILAFNPLWPSVTSPILKWATKGFRFVAGHNPPLPAGVDVTLLKPDQPLGSVTDALRWRRGNVERWLDMGSEAAANISLPNCLER